MHVKQVLVALIILIVLGLGFGYWASKTKPLAPAATQEQHVLAGTATSTGGYEYMEEGSTYTVSLLYPAKTALADAAADQKARLAMETELKAQLDDFKQNIAGLDASVMPSIAAGYKLALDAEYKTYSGSNTVSYAYAIFENTGGAHPNGYFKTFVFDQSGNQVGITQVADLKKLSALVSADVTAQIKQRLGQSDVTSSIFAEGLTPTENNYSNFVIDGDTLVILIPPYQVAAYVMGSFEVRVPLSKVK